MDNTPFSKKCELLAAIWFFYRDDENASDGWKDFFRWADIGLPLSYVVNEGLANIASEGIEIITDTWENLCEMLDIDPTAEYKTVEQIFIAAGDDE